MARQNPKTFTVPDTDDIKPGDSVKVCDDGERFWVTVTWRKGEILRGTIDNKLIGGQPYDYGDLIEFATVNVYQSIP
jgi:hypothetical protein